MRSKLLAIIALISCVTVSGVHAQKQFQVFATFIDDKGAPVTALQPSDVKLSVEDVDVKVVKVEPSDWPLKVQVLMDNGIGLGNANISQLRAGVQGALQALPPTAEVTLVTTAPQPRVLVRSTDRQAVLKGLDLMGGDSLAGRFVESLYEATDRIEKDKGNAYWAIITAGTAAGDLNVTEREINKILERLQQRPTTVHVVVFNTLTTASGGANQTQVGLAVTKVTGGRYESINAATRLATLLPEMAAQVAKNYERQSHQLRITAERPGGASGELGRVRVGARAGILATGISFEGR